MKIKSLLIAAATLAAASSVKAGVHFSVGVFAPAPYVYYAPAPRCQPYYYEPYCRPAVIDYCPPPPRREYSVEVPNTVLIVRPDGSSYYETRYTREYRYY